MDSVAIVAAHSAFYRGRRQGGSSARVGRGREGTSEGGRRRGLGGRGRVLVRGRAGEGASESVRVPPIGGTLGSPQSATQPTRGARRAMRGPISIDFRDCAMVQSGILGPDHGTILRSGLKNRDRTVYLSSPVWSSPVSLIPIFQTVLKRVFCQVGILP
jgi:hypothetical protein